MEALKQFESITYRTIVFRRNAAELLLLPEGDRFLLPSLEFHHGQRLAEVISSILHDKWNCNTVCLFELEVTCGPDYAQQIRYQVMECCEDEAETAGSRWVSVEGLPPDRFVHSGDHLALQQSLRQFESYMNGPRPGPFAKPEWFGELCQWIGESIAPMGLHLGKGFRQFNASPTFSLVRFETSGPAVWFKAVGEPNAKEFPITVLLSKLAPKYIAAVIATKPDWNGWLSLESAGTALDQTQNTTSWEAAAVALARLQIESIGKRNLLVPSGIRDLRATALADLVHPFLKTVGDLIEQQVKVPPPILTRQELLLLEQQIQGALARLKGLTIPDTLGHLDLNPGNIIASPRGCVFLDWAEAYFGAPFFTFQYLLECLRRVVGPDSALEAGVVALFTDQWQAVIPHAQIEEALSLIPLLAAFAYAAGSDVWADATKLRNPQTAGYLRSLTRRMTREATRLVDRRSPCFA